MRTFAKSQFRYSKSQRMGIFAFLAIMVLVEILHYFVQNSSKKNLDTTIPIEVFQLYKHQEIGSNKNNSEPIFQKFDPNSLSKNDWQDLGFSEKQVETIFKYKYSLGGKFSSKEEIRACYVISSSKFKELEPYIEFSSYPEYSEPNYSKRYVGFKKEETKTIRYSKFNPNDYQQEDWERIGFSSKQAASLLKYKRSLGGKFTSKQQIKSAFVMSEEKFREMEPYLDLEQPKSKGTISIITEEELPQSKTNHLVMEKFNPNNLSLEQWMALGFSSKQAQTILNYKKSLGGKFKDAETLKKCYAISGEKFKELEPYMEFEE